MPLDTKMVGQTGEAITHSVDTRWIMSYAAGLGDFNPRHLDPDAGEVVAHPLFPVCLEWPAMLASRKLPGYDALSSEEAARGVHASHDLEILRPIVDGDRLTTRATVTDLRAIKPGAAMVSRLDTIDAEGELVCRTHQLAILRGVEVTGEDVPQNALPTPPKLAEPWADTQRFSIAVPEGAAHIYTECARIWNPVHTDRAVALAAGLPDLILHGSATLAYAVTRLVNEYLGGDPTRVRRLGGRFTAMVMMPSTLTLEVLGRGSDALFYTVHSEDGEPAFSGGYLEFE